MSMESLKVLIVEDDNEVREVVNEDLKSLGYETTEAPDGEAAWKFIKSGKKFDAIISDINMPHLDGMAFLGRLKENGHDIPLVFLTAYGEKDRVLSALRYGAFDFLEKPYEFETLKKSIDRAACTGRLRWKINEELEILLTSLKPDTEKRGIEARKRLESLREELKNIQLKT